MRDCGDRYKKYKKLTEDEKWIGLYIWQHKNPYEATKNRKLCHSGFKCHGCVKSGTDRELKEGKKYSAKAYEISEKYGIQEMKEGKGGRIEIHNSGGRKINDANGNPILQKSTITEYNIDCKYILDQEKVKEFTAVYKRDGEEIEPDEMIPSNPNKKVRIIGDPNDLWDENNNLIPFSGNEDREYKRMNAQTNIPAPKKPPPRKSGELFQRKIDDSVNEAHSKIDEHAKMQEDVGKEMERKKKEFEEKKKKLEEDGRKKRKASTTGNKKKIQSKRKGGKKKRKTKKRSKQLGGRRKKTRKLFLTNFF